MKKYVFRYNGGKIDGTYTEEEILARIDRGVNNLQGQIELYEVFELVPIKLVPTTAFKLEKK